jgi:hypothetical protein
MVFAAEIPISVFAPSEIWMLPKVVQAGEIALDDLSAEILPPVAVVMLTTANDCIAIKRFRHSEKMKILRLPLI